MKQDVVKSKIKCPKCKSKDLILIEVWQGHTISWEQNDKGEFDRQEGNLESGDPHHMEAECCKCKHRWKIRRAIQIGDVII